MKIDYLISRVFVIATCKVPSSKKKLLGIVFIMVFQFMLYLLGCMKGNVVPYLPCYFYVQIILLLHYGFYHLHLPVLELINTLEFLHTLKDVFLT